MTVIPFRPRARSTPTPAPPLKYCECRNEPAASSLMRDCLRTSISFSVVPWLWWYDVLRHDDRPELCRQECLDRKTGR